MDNLEAMIAAFEKEYKKAFHSMPEAHWFLLDANGNYSEYDVKKCFIMWQAATAHTINLCTEQLKADYMEAIRRGQNKKAEYINQCIDSLRSLKTNKEG